MLSVDPRWRGNGIGAYARLTQLTAGASLVRTVINEMKRCGAEEIVLETEVDNAQALRLYEKFGFIREKRLFHFYLNSTYRCRDTLTAKTRTRTASFFLYPNPWRFRSPLSRKVGHRSIRLPLLAPSNSLVGTEKAYCVLRVSSAGAFVFVPSSSRNAATI